MAGAHKLSRTNLAFLVVNLIVLGGGVAVLCVARPGGPLILVAIGALGLASGKIGARFAKSKQPPASNAS